ncbi:unnamed protein product [Larinioides sclopetarius]|uniref:Uncharacterized protein n=1 Tax=Larinioides sclopetarius TaxID=280406 RepID=A0AAV1YVH1_9ARAC
MVHKIGVCNGSYPNGLSMVTMSYETMSHGEGAMDGVEGALKRMADTLVARGIDIIDMDYLLKNLKENGTTIHLGFFLDPSRNSMCNTGQLLNKEVNKQNPETIPC